MRSDAQCTTYSRSGERKTSRLRAAMEHIMSHRYSPRTIVVLAFGANLPSRWGEPPATFARAVARLRERGVDVRWSSALYRTKAVGPGLQENYYNAIVAAETALPPSMLLRFVKGLERQAGRRRGRLWGPRPLDIDLIDYKGFSLGKAGQVRCQGSSFYRTPNCTSGRSSSLPWRRLCRLAASPIGAERPHPDQAAAGLRSGGCGEPPCFPAASMRKAKAVRSELRGIGASGPIVLVRWRLGFPNRPARVERLLPTRTNR